MKQIHLIALAILILVITNGCYSQKKIVINKNQYNLNEKKVFLKDYNLMATSKQFTNGKGVFQFGYVFESKRNDSLYISGNMKIEGKHIVCTEKYFFNHFEKDSTKTTFRQDDHGKIFLKQYQEFRDGEIIKNQTF